MHWFRNLIASRLSVMYTVLVELLETLALEWDCQAGNLIASRLSVMYTVLVELLETLALEWDCQAGLKLGILLNLCIPQFSHLWNRNGIFFPLELNIYIYIFSRFLFLYYSWFAVFCHLLLYSKVTQSYIYIHSFSHIILHHVSSQVTRYSSLCHTAGYHCLPIPNAIVCIH